MGGENGKALVSPNYAGIVQHFDEGAGGVTLACKVDTVHKAGTQTYGVNYQGNQDED